MQDALGDTVHAGGSAGDVKIQEVSFLGGSAFPVARVIAKTPKGSSQDATCGDLDQGAKAIFGKIYKDTGWKGHAVVRFRGGLVSKATGKELPDVATGGFQISPAQAHQIDWSNGVALTSIDWSTYRIFCNPALK